MVEKSTRRRPGRAATQFDAVIAKLLFMAGMRRSESSALRPKR